MEFGSISYGAIGSKKQKKIEVFLKGDLLQNDGCLYVRSQKTELKVYTSQNVEMPVKFELFLFQIDIPPNNNSDDFRGKQIQKTRIE